MLTRTGAYGVSLLPSLCTGLSGFLRVSPFRALLLDLQAQNIVSIIVTSASAITSSEFPIPATSVCVKVQDLGVNAEPVEPVAGGIVLYRAAPPPLPSIHPIERLVPALLITRMHERAIGMAQRVHQVLLDERVRFILAVADKREADQLGCIRRRLAGFGEYDVHFDASLPVVQYQALSVVHVVKKTE